jgi:hypothetical protein
VSISKLVVGSVVLTDDNPVHPDMVTMIELVLDARQTKPGVYVATGAHPDNSEPVTVEIDHTRDEYRPEGRVAVKYGTGVLTPEAAERVKKVQAYRAGLRNFFERFPAKREPVVADESKDAPAAVQDRVKEQVQRAKKESEPSRQMPAVVQQPKTPAVKKEFVAGTVDGLPEQFVMKMGPKGQEKPYVLKAGLLFLAKKLGVREIKVKPVHWSFQKAKDDPLAGVAVAEATVILSDGTVFSDFGVASTENTNKMIHTNLDHMASTRASNRALRLATACGMCSVEELPDAPPEVLEAEATVIEG